MTDRPRVLILGATGQLGMELQRCFAGTAPLVALGREGLDLGVPADIRELVERVRPDVILNAAAYTAVDRAESEKERAFAVNGRGPRLLAEAALRANALLVHYSTDYVFDGRKYEPWSEDDATRPLNVYGASKLEGEAAIRQLGGRYLIFRTSWVYGPQGKNFLFTMLRLARERPELNVVNDQVGAPTTSMELARATRTVVNGVLEGRYGSPAEWAGVYHMTCEGSTTWCGFAQAIFQRAGALLEGQRPRVNPIPSRDYPTPARRPENSVLSNARLHERFGVQLAPWESALDEVMAILQKRAAAPQITGRD